PPHYNFLHIPTVSSLEPLWNNPENAPVVTGLATDKRELLITRMLDAEPDHRFVFPNPSIWPFISAVSTAGMLVSLLFSAWALPIGTVIVAIFLTLWFWPTTPKKEGEEPPNDGAAEAAA